MDPNVKLLPSVSKLAFPSSSLWLFYIYIRIFFFPHLILTDVSLIILSVCVCIHMHAMVVVLRDALNSSTNEKLNCADSLLGSKRVPFFHLLFFFLITSRIVLCLLINPLTCYTKNLCYLVVRTYK